VSVHGFAPPERIGFVGLGNMGAPMASRLARAGFTLAVADAAPAAVTRFAAQASCETPTRLAELGTCRAIVTMLPDGRIVREVLLGAQGIAAQLRADSVVIDMSSSSPIDTRATAAALKERGIEMVDAPVSGGVRKAIDGTLAIMAGGAAEVVERCRAILDALGKVFLAGPTGCGHAMKSLNNFLSAINLAAAAEAMIAGERFGLAPQVMISILNASTGRNSATEQKYPAYVLPRNFASGFTLGLMAKDLKLAVELAHSTQAPARLLELCSELWSQASERLGARSDNTEIVRYLEQLPAVHGTRR